MTSSMNAEVMGVGIGWIGILATGVVLLLIPAGSAMWALGIGLLTAAVVNIPYGVRFQNAGLSLAFPPRRGRH